MKVYNKVPKDTKEFTRTPLNIENLDFSKAELLVADCLVIPFKVNKQMTKDLINLLDEVGNKKDYGLNDLDFANFGLWIDLDADVPQYQIAIKAYPLKLSEQQKIQHIKHYGKKRFWSRLFAQIDNFYENPNWEDVPESEFYDITLEQNELIKLNNAIIKLVSRV